MVIVRGEKVLLEPFPSEIGAARASNIHGPPPMIEAATSAAI